MADEKSLTRPSVEVRIPEVRLRLQDLAFLRSLSQPDSIHCKVPDSVKDRLRFLDLIARASVPPPASKVAEVKTQSAAAVKELKEATRKKEWGKAQNAVYQLQSLNRKLEPTVNDVLTEQGKALLRKGAVTVRARQAGCVS